MAVVDMNLPVPTTEPRTIRVGKYELRGRLAVGGMAEMFIARTQAIHGFENLVALKRMLPQHASHDSGDVNADFSGDYRCLKFGQVGEPCARYSNGCRSVTSVCDGDLLECVELPKAGSPCTQWSNNGDGCAPSAFCDWNVNQCVARADQGEACGWVGGEFDGSYVQCIGALSCDESGPASCEPPVAGSTCAVPELTPLPGEG